MTMDEFCITFKDHNDYLAIYAFCMNNNIERPLRFFDMTFTSTSIPSDGISVCKWEPTDFCQVDVTKDDEFFSRFRLMVMSEAISKGVVTVITEEDESEFDPEWELILEVCDGTSNNDRG